MTALLFSGKVTANCVVGPMSLKDVLRCWRRTRRVRTQIMAMDQPPEGLASDFSSCDGLASSHAVPVPAVAGNSAVTSACYISWNPRVSSDQSSTEKFNW